MSEDTRFCYGAACTWFGPIQEVADTAKHPRWQAEGVPLELQRNSLPCCPHCGGMLYEMNTAKEFWDGVDRHDAEWPGYKTMLVWQRQMNKLSPLCFRSIAALHTTYENRERDPRFQVRAG